MFEIENNFNPEMNKSNQWIDFPKMLNDIKRYTEVTGHVILPCDKPTKLILGYICSMTNKVWWIKLTDLASSLNELDDSDVKKGIYKNCLKSQKGRLNLLASLNKAK